MPESIITAAASSIPPESLTALVASAMKWVWGVICVIITGMISVGKWFFNRQQATNNAVIELRNKHDQDMNAFLAHCGERHEREFSRSTDYATKDDIRTVHEKIDVISENVQAINTNVVNLAVSIKR